jgi:putative DNA primase/helicase
MKLRGVVFATARVIAAELVGCDDLVGADNDTAAGLTLAEYAAAKRLPADWLKQIGVREVPAYGPGKTPAIRTEYRRANGGQPSVRFRVNLNGDKKKRHFWRKGDKACLYGGDWAGGLSAAGFVVLVEGESDTQTLWLNGFPALGLPGANTWNEERDAPLFDGVPVVYVVIEPDTGGGEVMKWLSRSRIAPRARLIRLPPATKDPSALYLVAPERFCETFQAAMAAAEPLPVTTAPVAEIIDPAAPHRIAQRFYALYFTAGDTGTLRHHRGEFHVWNGAAYTALSSVALETGLYDFLSRCRWRAPQGELKPVKPNLKMVANVLHALRAVAWIDDDIAPPVWLKETADNPPADEITACANGLLHLPSRRLLPHTPAFFTHNVLDFAYDPAAPEPRQWLDFLSQVWPDDSASIETLQEIFGLVLTGDTRYQKAFLILGYPRSGKGTIKKILEGLVGLANTVSPNLAGLTSDFGLQSLIGKRLAIVPDARIGKWTDQAAVVERLLSITGEDSITISRKFLPDWTGRLQVRFLILSNLAPKFDDVSGALASRFIVLRQNESFLGREDLGLGARLLTELPGILNWALIGRDRLTRRGHFVQPASADEKAREFADLASPIMPFLRERCEIKPGARATVDDLFISWCDWCRKQKRGSGTKQSFGRSLKAALPWLKTVRPRDDEDRFRAYEGLRIKPISSGIDPDGIDLN